MKNQDKCICSLKQGDGVELVLPLPPTSLPFTYSDDGKTYNVLGVGEVPAFGKMKAFTISYQSIFPVSYNGLGVTGKHPSYYVEAITKMMENGKPVNLKLTKTAYGPLNISCKITSFNPTQKPGRNGAIDYTIQFINAKTLRSVRLSEQKITLPPATPYVPKKEEENPKTKAELMAEAEKERVAEMEIMDKMGITTSLNYTVTGVALFGEGGYDTNLVNVIKYYYKDTSVQDKILEVNPKITRPNQMPVGTVIKLPSIKELSTWRDR